MQAGEKVFGKSLHASQEEIALYVDALKLGRTDQLPEKLLNHVADCEHCKMEVSELYSLLEDVKYDREEKHPYFDKIRRKRTATLSNLYRIAAILAVAVGLGLVVYYFGVIRTGQEPAITPQASKQVEPGIESTKVAAESPATTKLPVKDLYAGNFVESPNLEDLVNNELRSGTVQVRSPLNGAVVGRKILFEWEGDNKGPFVLRILTNTEKVIVSRKLRKPQLLQDLQLVPGLYYWKLESNGELLYVGKFFEK